jgi:beta-galactosidase
VPAIAHTYQLNAIEDIMPRISRRHLIASGIAFSGSSILSRSAWARAASMPQGGGSSGAAGVVPPDHVRETLLFDFGWKFKFGHGTDPAKDLGFGLGQSDFSKTADFKPAKAGFDDSGWRALNLPHDWAVELPFEHDDNGAKSRQEMRAGGSGLSLTECSGTRWCSSMAVSLGETTTDTSRSASI